MSHNVFRITSSLVLSNVGARVFVKVRRRNNSAKFITGLMASHCIKKSRSLIVSYILELFPGHQLICSSRVYWPRLASRLSLSGNSENGFQAHSEGVYGGM